MFTRLIDQLVGSVICCPWVGHAYGHRPVAKPVRAPFLYSPAERRRRDASPWTMVQGVLAPLQFAVFLISLGFVMHYLISGHGYALATGSILVKTMCLLTIMITGAIWEKAVFGQYLFAAAFFWEDVFSFLVIALHLAYVAALFSHAAEPRALMFIALAAYASYVINAMQFIMKLRAARAEGLSA